MTNFTVTNLNDSGAGSLRQAIADAGALAGNDTISFQAGLTGQINLLAASGSLVIAAGNNVTINGDTNGDGAADITISRVGGGLQDPLLHVAGGIAAGYATPAIAAPVVVLNSLNFQGGYDFAQSNVDFVAGAITNSGNLSINYSTFNGNHAYEFLPSGDGASAAGGILNFGILNVSQTYFSDNYISIGSQGAPGESGGSSAGGIMNFGTLTAAAVLFKNNIADGGDAGPAAVFVGSGGHAAADILNFGTANGTFSTSGGSATGGYGPGIFGGSASNSVLNISAGTGTLTATVMGTFGNDTVTTAAGSEFFGLAGNDVLTAGVGGVLRGGAGNDKLIGSTGSEQLFGGLGNDTLEGISGVDSLIGGLGDDLYWLYDLNHILIENEGEGTDTVRIASSTISAYTLQANFENISSGLGGLTGNGNALDNLIFFSTSGGTIANGLAGNDELWAVTMNGGSGNDTFHIGSFSTVTEAASDGIDTAIADQYFTFGPYTLAANVENMVIVNVSNTINLTSITGNDLDNIFTFGSIDPAARSVNGGLGNDTYNIQSSNVTVTEAANAGTDTVQVGAGVFTLGANIENLTFTSGGTHTGQGNGLNNVVIGNAGGDTLLGLAGDDLLKGGDGTDTLDGGADIDTADFSNETKSVNVTLNGSTTVTALINGIASDTLVNIENLIGGAANDTLTGDGLSNTLNGGLGDDALSGMAGNDLFIVSGEGRDNVDGGADNDTIDLGKMKQAAWVNLAYNGDEVQTKIGGVWRNVANVAGVENVIGTKFDDAIYADAAANTISGNDGKDTIYGRAGNDTLVGGLGNDSLYGEANDDTLTADEGTDYLNGGSGNDTFKFSTAAGNLLDTADGDQGTDTVDASAFTGVAWVDLATSGYELYTINSGIWLGLANLSNIENVIGSNQNDEMYGDANNNRFEGGNGNDKLDGRGGYDTLLGGAGNDIITGGDLADTLDGGTGNDSFVFASNLTGLDTVDGGTDIDTADCSAFTTKAWVDFQYAGAKIQTFDSAWKVIANTSNVENAIGSAVADELYGDAAANDFKGGAGADIIAGRAGADTLTGGADSDTFKFALGDSGQTQATLDTITDFAKGAVGTGDKIDFVPALTVGGSTAVATTSQAQINATTGIATFAAGSGTTLADALADIDASFTAGGNAAGEFAFFRVNNTGATYMVVSDGVAGIGANDVLIQLTGITNVGSINLTGGDLTILT